ncbi:MAG: hypothetical protein WC551_07700 [Patescibacteria group bacterium]
MNNVEYWQEHDRRAQAQYIALLFLGLLLVNGCSGAPQDPISTSTIEGQTALVVDWENVVTPSAFVVSSGERHYPPYDMFVDGVTQLSMFDSIDLVIYTSTIVAHHGIDGSVHVVLASPFPHVKPNDVVTVSRAGSRATAE